MKKHALKLKRPNRTAVLVAGGIFAVSAVCNLGSAVLGAHPTVRSIAQVAILALTLSLAVLANAFAPAPSYPRFLRDTAVAAAVLAALAFALYALDVRTRPYTGAAAPYAVGIVIGFAAMAAAGRWMEKRGTRWP